MKLTNPTDDQLNAAFAEKVAGWFRTERLGKQVLYDPEGGHVLIGDTRCMPSFTTSADAVLPFVSKLKEVGIHYLEGDWYVRCWSEKKECANCDSLPKACVIALLRAHGVEIEFSKC